MTTQIFIQLSQTTDGHTFISQYRLSTGYLKTQIVIQLSQKTDCHSVISQHRLSPSYLTIQTVIQLSHIMANLQNCIPNVPHSNLGASSPHRGVPLFPSTPSIKFRGGYLSTWSLPSKSFSFRQSFYHQPYIISGTNFVTQTRGEKVNCLHFWSCRPQFDTCHICVTDVTFTGSPCRME